MIKRIIYITKRIIYKIMTFFNSIRDRRRIRTFGRSRKQDCQALTLLKDKHKGERCFILGNGPSLNKCDLTLLKNEISFAVNNIYYKTQETGYRPSYYMVEDNHVLKENFYAINNYRCDVKFFPENYRNKEALPDQSTIFIPMDCGFYREGHPYYQIPRFSRDVSREVFAGQSVTIMQLQMAFYLGFSEVYLIGMDFSYDVPKSTVIDGVCYHSQENDPNHFHPNYFGKGKIWHNPRLDLVLESYKKCKEEFESDGRKILNATVGGKLELFERVDYQSIFVSKK